MKIFFPVIILLSSQLMISQELDDTFLKALPDDLRKDVLERADGQDENADDKSVLLALDQITDPQNIGSIMRSCALFNCKGIIVAKDNAPDLTPSLYKAASGAAEIVNYFRVTNLKRSISELKKYEREDIMVIVGGVIPAQDYQFLFDCGAVGVFGPGTKIAQAAIDMVAILIDSIK